MNEDERRSEPLPGEKRRRRVRCEDLPEGVAEAIRIQVRPRRSVKDGSKKGEWRVGIVCENLPWWALLVVTIKRLSDHCKGSY